LAALARRLQHLIRKKANNGPNDGRRGAMKTNSTVSGLAQQYCKSVAATLLARNEFFELLEDATTSPVRLARARDAWRQHALDAQTLKGLARSG
jgi:hypothetical protein